jgi:hypothetical protein
VKKIKNFCTVFPTDQSEAELLYFYSLCSSVKKPFQKTNKFVSSFRLCNDPAICSKLVRLGGLSRLVELCKEPMERNYSDAVLVACLAVIRRIRNVSSNSDVSRMLDETEAADLVRPKMAESFLEHSAKQESYV